MVDKLALTGQVFTLMGASLLFFYGLPRKKYGNVIITGSTAFKFSPESGERDIPDSEWHPIADRFLKRTKRLNRTGFALVAVGTLLQIISMF